MLGKALERAGDGLDVPVEAFLVVPIFPVPLDLLNHQQQVQRVQQVALELELLVVVHAVEDVGCDLEQELNQDFVGEVFGVSVEVLQELRVALEGLLLELRVCVDFIAFGLQDPAQGLGVHVVDILLVQLERIHRVLEHLVVVDF